MPIILYTNARFDVGDAFDTRDYGDLNRLALEEASYEEREVEYFLEEVRKEHYPAAPDRLYAIVGMLLPSKESNVRHERGWGTTEMPAPEPMGSGAHCYHIQPARGAKYILADETLVGRLVQDWPAIKNRFERWELAQSYWNGNVVRGYSMLIRGPVKIEAECRWPRGSRRLKPVVWGAD